MRQFEVLAALLPASSEAMIEGRVISGLKPVIRAEVMMQSLKGLS